MPLLKSKSNIKIAVSLGDPCGIGPEIASKVLNDPEIFQSASFIVVGPAAVIRSFSWPSQKIEFVEIDGESSKFVPGQCSRHSGKAALETLRACVKIIQSGRAAALVTAPVSKEAIHVHQSSFQGHTEFLADAFGIKDVGMMFVGEKLRTIIVTRHMALKDVPSVMTKDNILSTVRLCDQALKNMFHLSNPVIGVCGLNPHAGENGLMGREEMTTIIPALEEARASGICVEGPFPADTIFAQDAGRSYDAIVAMYHDQGLIPVKTLSMKKLVNLTIGLPFVRTSPAHGTAFDIAGKNIADPSSMKEAVKLAIQLS